MWKLQLCGNSFKISNVALDFLNKYFARFEFYTKDNKVNQELFQDIKSSICEKLSQINREISDKDIIDIINDLWEPEDIFELPTSNNLKEVDSFWSGFNQQKLYYRYPQNWILFGICYWIWKKLQVDPLWIRLSMIILAFFYGLWIIIYISLIFLMPKVNWNNDSKWIFEKIFSAIIWIIKFIFIIVVFFVYFCLWSWFLAIGFTWMVVSPFLFTDVNLDNMSLFALVPMYFKIASVGLSISAFLFWLWLLVKSIWKKFLWVKFFLFNLFLFVFSLIWFFAWIYEIIFEKYMWEQAFQTQLASIPVLTWDYTFKIAQINDKFVMWWQSFDRIWNRIWNIKFENSSWTNLEIILDTTYYIWSKQLWEQIHQNSIPLKVNLEWDSISLERDWYLSYSQKVPWTVAIHQLVFRVPNNVKIDFRWSLQDPFVYKFYNVKLSKDIFNRLFVSCKYGLIFYSNLTNEFQCEKWYKNPSLYQKELQDYIVNEKTITRLMIENPVYKVAYEHENDDDLSLETQQDYESWEYETEQFTSDIEILTWTDNIIKENNTQQIEASWSILTWNEQLSWWVMVHDKLTSKTLKENSYLIKIVDKNPDYYEFRWMWPNWAYLFVTYWDQYFYIYVSMTESEAPKQLTFSLESMWTIDQSMANYIELSNQK